MPYVLEKKDEKVSVESCSGQAGMQIRSYLFVYDFIFLYLFNIDDDLI